MLSSFLSRAYCEARFWQRKRDACTLGAGRWIVPALFRCTRRCGRIPSAVHEAARSLAPVVRDDRDPTSRPDSANSQLTKRLLRLIVTGLAGVLSSMNVASSEDSYPAVSHAPRSAWGWEGNRLQKEPGAPSDEPQVGATLRGTPVSVRNYAHFKREERNLFSNLDMPRGSDGQQRSIFKDGPSISPKAQEAIRGQNAWMLWSGGNEAFWGWLQEHNYGLTDFLVVLDSRKRGSRFKEVGLINQPGMKSRTDRTILGLYLDRADAEASVMQLKDANYARPDGPAREFFKPYDLKAYQEVLSQLPSDGADPAVYGYSTGVVGLRLFPNPDFFADTAGAKRAREYWQVRVEQRSDHPKNNYYHDPEIPSDPDLIRPFRIGMTCAFCHIGPHPLNPPDDPEKPEWANLSSTIGAQYWRGSKAFSNLKKKESFLYQVVNSWQPGTLDTSLISTDQINNPNTMNGLFDIPARMGRALQNPPEVQSKANLLYPAVENAMPFANPRHTPRMLVDGADSIGIKAALARVYLNIGTYHQQWIRLHNPIFGFRPQRPFELATIAEQSAYWRATQPDRISDTVAFFMYSNQAGETVTGPMKLANAPGGQDELALDRDGDRVKGRKVFLDNCAICHSSKQPQGFELSFSRQWNHDEPLKHNAPAQFVLPMDFAEWEVFRRSAAYGEYKKRIAELAGDGAPTPDLFLQNNYLSSDIRIPVTLVGTNSARAVATNAMRGQVWDNFSSETYKSLEPVGAVRFYNPYSGAGVDEWGNNDSYFPAGGGPGYYRPATLISIWATAPFLHNNALGRYTGDPSVRGRLLAFNDGIDKLLWKSKRLPTTDDVKDGDLRLMSAYLAGRDPGFIYRTTDRSCIDIPPKFVRQLLAGVIGETWTSILTLYLWIALGVVAVVFIWIGRQQDAGFALLLLGVLVAAALRVTRIDTIYPALWFMPGVAVALALVLWVTPRRRVVARLFFGLLAACFLAVAFVANDLVDGNHGGLNVGPIPQGTPVNLLMNLNPQAPAGDLVEAVSAVMRGLLRIIKDNLSDTNGAALHAFEAEAGLALLKVSKSPDFVLDRGHWFAEGLSEDEKQQLKAFLKTL